MQYKIPVQIEKADNIVLGLSLKQLITLIIWFWIAYSVFDALAKRGGFELWIIPAVVIAAITVVVTFINIWEMTFQSLLLSFIRYSVNLKDRSFLMGTDSYQPIEIWYVTMSTGSQEKSIDFETKMDKIKSLDDQLKKI